MRSRFRVGLVTLGAVMLAAGVPAAAYATEGDETTCHAMTDDGHVVALPANVCSDIQDVISDITVSDLVSVDL